MEKRIEERLQIALGQVIAANTALAALCKTHPDKTALSAAMKDFDALSMDVLRHVERQQPDRGQTMQEAYLQQMAGFRNAMLPG